MKFYTQFNVSAFGENFPSQKNTHYTVAIV